MEALGPLARLIWLLLVLLRLLLLVVLLLLLLLVTLLVVLLLLLSRLLVVLMLKRHQVARLQWLMAVRLAPAPAVTQHHPAAHHLLPQL